ncbi:MAG: AraC family transcriptional regulator [Eubacteriales bacterium]|nr:AraC family transcriptional regulator [Eubacteriales bacterium]
MSILIELKDDYSEKVHYNRSDYPIYIKSGLLSHYPNYAAPNHWHDDIEMIAVLDGEMKYNVNGEIINLTNGNGILVNSGQMHFGFSDARSECNFICVLLHPMLLCSTASYENDFVLPVIRNNAIPYIFLDPNTSWQKKILEQIHFMYKRKGLKTMPLDVQSSFSAIWSLLYDNIPPNDNILHPQSSDLSITKNMVGFIQKYYTHKISLMDIAASGAVGQSKCCKLFAKYFNQTPNIYLTQYRLNKSIELLRNTDISITEIAFSVGFSGASYYAETFRKWFGQSPTKFRNESMQK